VLLFGECVRRVLRSLDILLLVLFVLVLVLLIIIVTTSTIVFLARKSLRLL
jgi:hypothetical protein